MINYERTNSAKNLQRQYEARYCEEPDRIFVWLENIPLKQGTRLRCGAGFDVKDVNYRFVITMSQREQERFLDAIVLEFLGNKERDEKGEKYSPILQALAAARGSREHVVCLSRYDNCVVTSAAR